MTDMVDRDDQELLEGSRNDCQFRTGLSTLPLTQEKLHYGPVETRRTMHFPLATRFIVPVRTYAEDKVVRHRF